MNKIAHLPSYASDPEGQANVFYGYGYIATCCGSYAATSIEEWLRISTGITVYIGSEYILLPEDDEWNRHTRLVGLDGDFIYIKELLKGYEVVYNNYDEDVTEDRYPFEQEAPRDISSVYKGIKNPKTPYVSVHFDGGWKYTGHNNKPIWELMSGYKLAFFIVTRGQFSSPENKYGLEQLDRMPTFWEAKSYAQNGNYPSYEPNLKLIIKEINNEAWM